MDVELTVRDNVEDNAYEAMLDGRLVGRVLYERKADRVVVRSTVVDPRYRNRGIGGRLVRAALDDVASAGLSLTNYCGFVTDFLAANPEYLRLVDGRFPGKTPV
ncbi:MAG TPA: GNAT family N-acetyltransferase [Pseudonocardiaceae bacterium]|nr:GNAT family N-acetyltransferase [Pseudonocardiaceae bacterium]